MRYIGTLSMDLDFIPNKWKQQEDIKQWVVVTTRAESYSRTCYLALVAGAMEYHGIIKEIIKSSYYGHMKIVLLKPDRYDVNSCNSGIKVDEYRFTLVNTSCFLSSTEPYVLASQVCQLFYGEDHEWDIVIKFPS